MSERYTTVKEFCHACGLSNYRIEWHITQLNQLWIKQANDPKRFKSYLEGEWLSGNATLRGVCEWIVDLVKLGASAGAPVAISDGTAIMIKNEKRDMLLQKLAEAYGEVIVDSLRFSSTDVDERVARHFNKYSVWLMQTTSVKIKLIWALLGYCSEDCNLSYFIDNLTTPLVEAKLLPIMKARARSGNQQVPERLCEVDTDAELRLLCMHNAAEEPSKIATAAATQAAEIHGDGIIAGKEGSFQQSLSMQQRVSTSDHAQEQMRRGGDTADGKE